MNRVASVGFAIAMVAALTMAMQAKAADTVDAMKGQQLARKNACMGCHAVERKLVGPSYQQIAEKYKGDPAAVDLLVKKVLSGGAGVWGMVPMPSHPNMHAEDARAIVVWVLAGAPKP